MFFIQYQIKGYASTLEVPKKLSCLSSSINVNCWLCILSPPCYINGAATRKYKFVGKYMNLEKIREFENNYRQMHEDELLILTQNKHLLIEAKHALKNILAEKNIVYECTLTDSEIKPSEEDIISKTKRNRGISLNLLIRIGRTSKGRLSKLQFFQLFLTNLLVSNLMIFGLLMLSSFFPNPLEFLLILVCILLAIFFTYININLIIKRYHDLGKSDFWILILLIPYIGWIYAFFELFFVKGNESENAYGPKPEY